MKFMELTKYVAKQFFLQLCVVTFFSTILFKNQFWAVCSRILHIDQNFIQVANSRAAARSVSEPSLQSVTLACLVAVTGAELSPCFTVLFPQCGSFHHLMQAVASGWLDSPWVVFRWAQTRQVGLFLVSRHHSDKAVEYKDCNNAADPG